MPTSDTIEDARQLIERHLAGLDEERRRLERALAELGGKRNGPQVARAAAPRRPKRPRARRKNAVAEKVAPAPIRPSS